MKFPLPLLFLALLCTSLLHAEQGPADWPLRTVFPSKIDLTSRKPSHLDYWGNAECEFHKHQYRIVRSTYPKAIPEGDRYKVYEAARKRYFDKDDKVLIDESDCLVAGVVAHRIVFSYRKGSRVVDLRLIISGRDVFEMAHEYGINDKVTAEADDFFGKAVLVQAVSKK